MKNISYNKGFWSIVVCLMLALGGMIYYKIFSVETIDLNQYYIIEVKGISGEAEAKVDTLYNNRGSNEQINKFLEESKLTYTLSKSEKLKNNDIIEIRATYDENIAKKYKVKPVNKVIKYEVVNLPEFIKNLNEVLEFIQSFIAKQEQINLTTSNATQHTVRLYYKYDKDGNLEIKNVSVVYGSFVSYLEVHATIMYYAMDMKKLYKENNEVKILDYNNKLIENMYYELNFSNYDEMFNFIDTANNQLDVIMEQEGYKKFE